MICLTTVLADCLTESWVILHAYIRLLIFFFKYFFFLQINSFLNTIRVTKGLDPGQARRPGSKLFANVKADDTGRQIVNGKVSDFM